MVSCNACGETAQGGNKYEAESNLHRITVRGGYGCDYPEDLTDIRFAVCSTCLTAWTKTFKVAPTVTPYSL
jgi:hypothetical protein